MTSALPSVVGDIGGTHARFAVVTAEGRIGDSQVLYCASYPDLGAALIEFLDRAKVKPADAALAVASPVTDDSITLTNHAWTFSVAELRRRLELRRLLVVNDFTAVSLAAPQLGPEDTRKIGGGSPVAGAPIAV